MFGIDGECRNRIGLLIAKVMYTKPRFLARDLKENIGLIIFQSVLAGGTILLALLILHGMAQYAVIIASIGSTAFTVFTIPNAISAKSRNVVGGHIVGMIAGSIAILIATHSIMVYAIAVGLASFFMCITDTEHPPAAGTALGTSIAGFSIELVIFVSSCAVILATAHYALRPWLREVRR